MYRENEAELKFLGLDKWERYTGKGIVCRAGEGDSGHSRKGVATGTTFNKDIDIGLVSCGLRCEDGELAGPFIENLDWIKENVDILNLSVGGSYSEKRNNLFKELAEAGVIVVTSAGNSSDRGVSGYAKSKHILSIANSFLYKGEVRRYRTSSIGEGIDFTMFGNWFINLNGKKVQVNGTSFSSYFVAFVILPRIQQFFIEEVGRKLNPSEMYNFLLDNCLDLGSPEEFGNGIITLPAPEEIDANKYTKKEGGTVNKPEKIILHNSGTNGGTFESIRKYHIEVNGWDDIGYHYLIETDGSSHKGRAEEVVGAHTKGENGRSIGICLVGNFEKYEPNERQLETLYSLLEDIFKRHGKLPIYGHKHFASTACPGAKFPMQEVLSRAYQEIVQYPRELSEWAKEAYEWAVKENISDGSDPKGSVTREQFWTMLYRYHNKHGK